MGMRVYRLVVQRELFVRAPNKRTVVEKIENGEVEIYEDEVIVEMKERTPKREMMPLVPVYTPSKVLKRRPQQQEEGAVEETPAVEEVTEPTAEATPQEAPQESPSQEAPSNVIPFPAVNE